jgi:signal transduction histidine kinase
MDLWTKCGDTGRLIATKDWTKTSLGSIDQWPQSLINNVSLCLQSRFPMVIYWGEGFRMIYNDALIQILGDKHPSAMGEYGLVILDEIKSIIGPLLQRIMEGGESIWAVNSLLPLMRKGFIEECYFTFSYSATRDENNDIGGVFCAVVETTSNLLDKRRLTLLKELSRATKAGSTKEAFKLIGAAISICPEDIPFSMLYMFDSNNVLTLQACTGLEYGADASPWSLVVDGADQSSDIWAQSSALKNSSLTIIEDIRKKFGLLPGSPWPEPMETAAVTPIQWNRQSRGILIVGISPRLKFDDQYKDFLELVVGNISQVLGTVEAFEEQKRIAEELALVDKAKTLFFTNVSHEFRTPLALMIGPLADSLNDVNHPLDNLQRERQLMIQRSTNRLLKLVNGLLDFARIEAGKSQITFRPTDLRKLTREICSLFEPVMKQASLEYILDINPIDHPIYVDVDCWEKIVLNLISNAFKFTMQGAIKVSLFNSDGFVQLTVKDTGVGIRNDQLLHIFERFYRIEDSQGRSYEGSGIGLALIQELVKLHHGDIQVESTFGQGTCFTVNIPVGKSHLPADKIQEIVNTEVSDISIAFIEECRGLIMSDDNSSKMELDSINHPFDSKSRILLVEDNADMRSYAKNILQQHWTVQTASDGESAYELACNDPPNLILSDIMMPKLDGFGLLRKIRSNSNTSRIPMILLSARAGEESKIEGLEKGADDYLVKTSFSEKELVARVRNHIELGQLRANLETEVAKATLELSQFNSELFEFIDVICHEIRNPLHGMLGNWQLLMDKLMELEIELHEQSNTPENIYSWVKSNISDMNSYMASIKECIMHQTNVMEDAVLRTQLSRKNYNKNPSFVNLHGVVLDTISAIATKIDLKPFSIKYNTISPTTKGLIDIQSTKYILKSVLIHLISNSNPGRSTITINQLRKQNIVWFDLESSNTVLDKSGTQALLSDSSVFSKTLGSTYYDTAMSLTLSNKLIDIIGGDRISMTCRKHGTINFMFGIPCNQYNDDIDYDDHVINLPKEYNSPKLLPSTTKRVLIVEDNQINQTLCNALLRKQGYECVSAFNGKEAVEKFKSQNFDLILMDVSMPIMDGITATTKIREYEKQLGSIKSQVFIVGLSAYSQQETIDRAFEAGMNNFITKPATFNKIIRIIEQLGQKSLQYC